MPVVPAAVSPASRLIELLILAIQKGIKRGVCLNQHTSAFPAVAAVRSAFGNKGLPAKAEASTPPPSGYHCNAGLIYELHDGSRDEVRVKMGSLETAVGAPDISFDLTSWVPQGRVSPLRANNNNELKTFRPRGVWLLASYCGPSSRT
jgi:hypothetical protein